MCGVVRLALTRHASEPRRAPAGVRPVLHGPLQGTFVPNASTAWAGQYRMTAPSRDAHRTGLLGKG